MAPEGQPSPRPERAGGWLEFIVADPQVLPCERERPEPRVEEFSALPLALELERLREAVEREALLVGRRGDDELVIASGCRKPFDIRRTPSDVYFVRCLLRQTVEWNLKIWQYFTDLFNNETFSTKTFYSVK